ncbi:MAG: TonB-dependent receptor [Acidobacteria bacterium]|nr:TonB-dependent receptor [Acidobacteriota bacterium]
MKSQKKIILTYLRVVVVLLAWGIVSHVVGQTATTGAIVGTVQDPQNDVIPGTTVRATNLRTNEVRSVQTGQAGDYFLPLLPVGDYRIQVNAPGFAPFDHSPITVRVTETVTINVTLHLGSIQEAVTVTDGVEMIQRASPVLGGVVDPKTIVGLPLATRNFTQLLTLSPGVSTSVPNATGHGLNSIELSSQGARVSDNSVQINGSDAMNIFTQAIGTYVSAQGVAVPAADTLEEFKVQTALYSAATGRNAGANIAVITKSGTNQFHGTAYEFLRNDVLNANDFFFNRAGLPSPALKQNQFGFTVGGPIQKNALFFFGSYQGTRQRNAVAPSSQSTAFLPPLTDDRSPAALGAIFGGQRAFSSLFEGELGTAVAPDGSNINPVALALLNFRLPNGEFLIPSPHSPSGLSKFSAPGRFSEDQCNLNLDRQFGARGRLSGKYFYSNQRSYFPLFQDETTFSPVPGFGASAPGRNHNFSLIYTHIFTPRFINLARFGYTRLVGMTKGDEPVKVSDVGMTTAPGIDTLPLIQVQGLFSVGASPNEEQGSVTNTFNLADSVFMIQGRHSMQFGVEAKRHRSAAFTRAQQHAALVFLDFPSFLLGQSSLENETLFSHVAATVTFAGGFDRDYQISDVAAYFQDDIRLTPRLNLNAGLRWEFFGVPVDRYGRNSNFDFARALSEPPAEGTVSGFVVGRNTPGTLPPEVIRADTDALRESQNLKNFGPRFGIAFQPFEGRRNLVLRAGYGIYFSRSAGILSFQNVVALPFGQVDIRRLEPFSMATFQNPLPPILPASAFPLFVPRFVDSTQTFTSLDPRMRDPYTQHVSLGLQYEFAPSYLLDIAYVGTKGTHLIGSFGSNQPLLASKANPIHGITINSVANARDRVPYQGLDTNISQSTSGFSSIYHSLQASVTKRFGRGLQFTSAYTFSKALDNLGQRTGGALLAFGGLGGDQRDFSQNRGLSVFDRKHRLVSSFIWQLPRMKGRSLFLRALLNDWEVSGVLTLQSGIPLTIMDTGAGRIYGRTNSRAQFAPDFTTRNTALSGSVTSRLDRFFNIDAFTTAPAIGIDGGTGYGNSGRGILRGPDQRNLDLALVRRFRLNALGEASNLEFRAEAFNFPNTPSFASPGANRAVPASFGVISSTSINPRVLQFALKLNF